MRIRPLLSLQRPLHDIAQTRRTYLHRDSRRNGNRNGNWNHHDHSTQRKRYRDGLAAQRCRLCSQYELELIFTCSGIRQGLRDSNDPRIRCPTLPQRRASRHHNPHSGRTVPTQNTKRLVRNDSTSHKSTGTSHRHLAPAYGPSRRGQRQEIGKNGRWNGNQSQDNSGSMRSMFGRKTAQATVPPAGNKSQGTPRTHPQRFVWTDRSNNVQRNELLRPLYRRLHQDDAYLSSQEEIIGKRVGKVQRIPSRSGETVRQIDQEAQDRWRRRIRKMDGSPSQGIRHYPRNDSPLQPRPERRGGARKSHHHGESQGYHRRSKTRQTTLDGNRRYCCLPQESQSNKRSRKYALRTLARHGTESVSSQNHRIDSLHSRSKGKAHQARHPLTQRDYDRLRRRHESIQSMGFDKGLYRCVKGCGVYRREASQPNSGSLRGTKDHPRLDYSPARTASRNQRSTATTYASAIGTPRFRFRFGRTRNGRPSSPIARILGKGASDRRNGKRINTKGIRTTRQRDLHLHEISRRKVQQRTTNSHGKDCTELRSQRRGRTSNSAGGHQSSHTREAVGESHPNRVRIANQ